jgi:hypothetical protein
MKTREQDHIEATDSQGQMIDDPDLNVSRFFALLYSIDQRNKEEKGVSNKSGDSPHPPTEGACSVRKHSA